MSIYRMLTARLQHIHDFTLHFMVTAHSPWENNYLNCSPTCKQNSRCAKQQNKYLSSPNRTRHEEASSLEQYLHPLAIRQGKSMVSAST